MRKVHVLIAAGGEYEDAWTRVEKVSLVGPVALEELIVRLQAEQAQAVKLCEEYEAADKEWKLQNPQPIPSHSQTMAVDRLRPAPWIGTKGVKQVITAEMRAARAEQARLHQDAWNELMRPTRDWQSAYSSWRKGWWELRGLKPADVLTESLIDVTWTIEEHDAID